MENVRKKVNALYGSFAKLSKALNAIWDEEKTSINRNLLPLQKAIADIGNGFSDITEALIFTCILRTLCFPVLVIL
jgi:hypothetical protein